MLDKWTTREVKRYKRELREAKEKEAEVKREISEKSNVGNVDTLAKVVKHIPTTGDPVVDHIKTCVNVFEKVIKSKSKGKENDK